MDWKSTHPLLRYAGFDNVQVTQSLTAKTPAWAVSLAEAPQAPIMLAGDLGRQRIVWVGFDMLESNWPLRVSFPIFIANAVEWLNPANAKSGQLLVKAGDAFRLSLAQPEKKPQVICRGAQRKPDTIDPKANEFVFGDTFQQGTYRLRIGTNETIFAWICSMRRRATSSRETSCSWAIHEGHRHHDTTNEHGVVADHRRWRDWWMLMLEWWYYHRRTV